MRFHLTADLHSHTVHGEVRGVSPHLLPCGLSGQLVCQLMESLLSLPPDSRGLQTLSGTGIQVGQWFRSLCLTSSANLPTEPSPPLICLSDCTWKHTASSSWQGLREARRRAQGTPFAPFEPGSPEARPQGQRYPLCIKPLCTRTG